jgi:hypothetical protein
VLAYASWEGTAKKAIPAIRAPAPDISLNADKRDLRFMTGSPSRTRIVSTALRSLHTVPLTRGLAALERIFGNSSVCRGAVVAGKEPIEVWLIKQNIGITCRVLKAGH